MRGMRKSYGLHDRERKIELDEHYAPLMFGR